MSWVEALATPVLAFLGVSIAEVVKIVLKKMDIDVAKDARIETCKKAHTENLEKTKEEFNKRLDEIDEKIDALNMAQVESKALYQNVIASIELLSGRVEKHNNVIERTYKLETDVEVLKNRESVSEHRLTDLEKK